jgi:hypothetical protein
MAIVVILPLVAAPLLWLAWRSVHRIAKPYVLVLAIIAAYLAFREVYPPDRFFVNEFTCNSTLILSPSARVVYRLVDVAPHLGDYNCEALIELDSADFARLTEELKKRKSASATKLIVRDTLTHAYGREFDVADWVGGRTAHADWLFWGLLRDGKTLFFYSIVT